MFGMEDIMIYYSSERDTTGYLALPNKEINGDQMWKSPFISLSGYQ